MDTLFLERARYFLNDEFRTQIRRAVEALPAGRLWWRPNDQSNSIGNLVLHLTGNIRQWIVSGVHGRPDTRHRAAEFSARQGGSAADLLADLDSALTEVDQVLAGLSGPDLVEHRDIQGRHVTVLDAIFQVVEHFSYHLGQIVFIAKMHEPGAIQFYEDVGDTARPIWKKPWP